MFNRFASLLVALLLTCSAHAEVWQARYGVAETFNFKLYNADGTLDVDEADGGTEVSVSCNEGAETTATNDFVDEGTFYSIALTSGEMSCERVAVVIAATTTEVFFIQTNNHASAMTPVLWADVQNFGGSAGTFASGRPEVNTTHLAGTSQTGRDIGASVLLSSGTGTGQLSFTSGVVAANSTQWGGTAVASARPLVDTVQISGDSAAADALELAFDGTATGARIFGIDHQGTAAAVDAGTITLAAGAAYGDNTLTGATIWGCGSTQGYCQFNSVASNVGATDVLTLSANWGVTPSGTVTYYLYGTAAGSGAAPTVGEIADAVFDEALAGHTTAGTAGERLGRVPNAAAGGSGGLPTVDANNRIVGVQVFDEDSTTIDINGTTLGTVTTATTATNLTNLPTIPANWLTAAGTAADFTTEVQTGLATAAAVAAIDALADAIKAKTDNLTFTVTGEVDSNAKSMNDEPVCGTGDTGTPWKGCP